MMVLLWPLATLKKGFRKFMREGERERERERDTHTLLVVVAGCCCLKLIKKKLI
jgi:hypothetical protein